MKVFNRVALVLLAGSLFTVPAFAGDDAKAPHGDDSTTNAAAGKSASAKNANGEAASTDKKPATLATTSSSVNAAPTPPPAGVIDPNAGTPAPMPASAVASGSYQSAAAYNASIKWNPMPAGPDLWPTCTAKKATN